jgi:membrane protein
MTGKEALDLTKETFRQWSEDKVSRLAAAVAYYALFSLAPLLVILVVIIGFVYGPDAAEGRLVDQIGGAVGDEAAQTIETAIANAYEEGQGTLATILSLAILAFTATGVVVQLQDSLDTVWGVHERPDRGIMSTIMSRVWGFVLVAVIGVIVIASFVADAVISGLLEYFAQFFPGAGIVGLAANFVLSLAIFTLIFGAVFKLLPHAEVAWRDVWLGAFVTAVLFSIGKIGLGLYLGRAGPGSMYGAAGSLVALLVWVYYSAQLLLLGAEFTQVYANRYGSKVKASEQAVPLTPGARAQEGVPTEKQKWRAVEETRKGGPQRDGKRAAADVQRDRRPAGGGGDGAEDADGAKQGGGSVYKPYYTPFVTLAVGWLVGRMLTKRPKPRPRPSPTREAMRVAIPIDERGQPDIQRLADSMADFKSRVPSYRLRPTIAPQTGRSRN